MKRYRLIKEYPGSKSLPTILIPFNGYWIYQGTNIKFKGHPVDYPEFWQEVIEKDYEILSFKSKSSNRIITLRGNGYYVVEPLRPFDCPNNKGGSLKQQLYDVEKGYYIIHSVKRLSDGEVFTVGDEIITGASDSYASIYGFKIVNKKLCINHTHSFLVNQMCPGTPSDCHLYLISKKIKPLFTTEDGVDIFEGDIHYGFTFDTFCIFKSKTSKDTSLQSYRKFSTKKAAEEYVLMNKPCLSLNDVFKVYPKLKRSSNNIWTKQASEIIQLVKTKL